MAYPIREEGQLSILMLADALLEDAPGGGRRVVHELAHGLANRGHAVTLVAPRLSRSLESQSQHTNLRVLRLGHGRQGTRGLPALVWETRQGLARELARTQRSFDILNVHFAYSHLPLLLPTRQHLAKRAVRTFYGPWALEALAEQSIRSPGLSRRVLAGWLRYKAQFQVEHASLACADHVVALSEYSARQLTDIFSVPRDAISLIPGGIDHQRFILPIAGKSDLRRQLRLPSNGVLLLTVRRLAARMGLDNLIAAMPGINQVLPEQAHLVIVGQGPIRAHLQAQVAALGLESTVHFAGLVTEELLPSYYQAADLFVLPSRSLEGFGLVTLEAFASGLPVLGTPIGATPELLSQVDERLILKGAGPEAIVEGTRAFFSQVQHDVSPEQLRDVVLQKYTWESMVIQTEKLFFQQIRHSTGEGSIEGAT